MQDFGRVQKVLLHAKLRRAWRGEWSGFVLTLDEGKRVKEGRAEGPCHGQRRVVRARSLHSLPSRAPTQQGRALSSPDRPARTHTRARAQWVGFRASGCFLSVWIHSVGAAGFPSLIIYSSAALLSCAPLLLFFCSPDPVLCSSIPFFLYFCAHPPLLLFSSPDPVLCSFIPFFLYSSSPPLLCSSSSPAPLHLFRLNPFSHFIFFFFSNFEHFPFFDSHLLHPCYPF